jgi:rhamnogalacturonan endolyase
MMKMSRTHFDLANALIFGIILLYSVSGADAQRQMEKLGRGVVAIHKGDGEVYVGWRMLGTDPRNIGFNLYRTSGEGEPQKLNDRPITRSTNYVDTGVDVSRSTSYFVRPVLDGIEQPASRAFTLPADAPAQPYLRIPLRTPPGYTPNDASVGDLDGDGECEIVLQQTGRGRDNAHAGFTDPPILEAYKLDGTLLWRINLGRNIREGAHYTQFMVYDLDGNGRAEIACKTADGTIDGTGKVIGDPDADWRNSRGYILDGPEYLTIFDGATGAALVTTEYIPPRGRVADWGDDYGNRVDRFLACVAYLDGRQPSLVMCRGYYTRTVLAAWNWRDGELTHLWTFDSDDGTPGNRAYRGQGYHSLAVGDITGDGRDEIIYGACAIKHDGTGLYSTGLGHGDAMHLSNIDPDRPGLEVWGIHERPNHPHGANLRDAATGEVLWGLKLRDPGRGLAIDIDPRHRGYECWTNDSDGLYNCKGEKISDTKPRSCNMAVWWDGDLLRELLNGTTIDKWDWEAGTTRRLLTAEGCAANNGSKSNPCLHADILGDWREEVIWRTRDNTELRIYTTTIPTEHRMPTLMHDPIYRLAVAWQNVGYNQPTQPGFYLGEGMDLQQWQADPDEEEEP